MTEIQETLRRGVDNWIEQAYQKIVAADPQFKLRESQVDFSKAVANALMTNVPLVAEAPTGTGKTLAYLVGALAFAETPAFETSSPVLVSTATKALQQQLLTSDLPRLQKAGLVKPDELVLAKGKGNYLCAEQTLRVVDTLERGMFDSETYIDKSLESLELSSVEGLLQAFNNGSWDGDFDQYDGNLPKTVWPLAVNTDTCNRRKCAHFNNCAYFKARARLAGSKIIIGNHDLILRELWLRSTEAEMSSLPVGKLRIVFDEAHHLPEKAINVGASEMNIGMFLRELPRLSGGVKLVRQTPALMTLASAQSVDLVALEAGAMAQAVQDVERELDAAEVDPDTLQLRYRLGEIPESLKIALEKVKAPLSEALISADRLLTGLRDATGLSKKDAVKADECLRRVLNFKALATEFTRCGAHLCSGKRYAKWLYKDVEKGALVLNAMPLEAADVLNRLLWKSADYKSAVMVSATLRDLGTFNRFRQKTGVSEDSTFLVLPYTFPYEKSVLHVPYMRYTPKPAERKLFLAELKSVLPRLIDKREGTLLLLPSWTMLKDISAHLKGVFGDQLVRSQGDANIKQLLAAHRRAIDAGQGSLLLGVATMSEGLDLPGKYCTHVLIASLPFAVPTDPVEQELAERLGRNYFQERSLPDAMVRLTQMVGRLLRRESDVGRLTILDRRIASTGYGVKMLDNLPPFKIDIEQNAHD